MLSLVSFWIGSLIGDGHFSQDALRSLLPREPQRGVDQLYIVKEPGRLGLGHWRLVPRIGHVEHKVQRPTQQLGQRSDRPGKAKGLETSHP